MTDLDLNKTRAVIAGASITLLEGHAMHARFGLDDFEFDGNRAALAVARDHLMKITVQLADAVEAIDRILESGK